MLAAESSAQGQEEESMLLEGITRETIRDSSEKALREEHAREEELDL